ncbi:MAG: RsbRD N-terminal domain-containing protein [Verrucomicrobiaceae bacterium]
MDVQAAQNDTVPVPERTHPTRMHSKPEAHPESVNGGLADYLHARKEAVLAEWRERVRSDKAIVAPQSLNATALTNRLPDIFDDLTASLRRYGSASVAEQTVKDAGDHGATRLNQGYELTEVLRELMHLRAILIYHLCQFEDLHPDHGLASRLFVSTTMHRFLDEMATDATDEYLWSKLSIQDQIHRGRTPGRAGSHEC